MLTVSCGDLEGARRHLAETGAPFPLLLNPGRELYKHFGLDRMPISKLLQQSTLEFFAGRMAAGLPVPHVHPGEDMLQLGGDFIVDSRGLVTFLHCSTDPSDRPSVEGLLDALTEMGASGDHA